MSDPTLRAERAAPSARRLLIGFLVFGAAFSSIVVVVVGALLLKVRTDTERDVTDMLRTSVSQQLSLSTLQQTDLLQQEMRSATAAIEYLSGAAKAVYEHPVAASPEEVARYGYGPGGTYVTKVVDGGASMFYSGIVPIGPEQRAKAEMMAALDPALKAVVSSDPLVAQAYINTWDSLNRIYPGFDVVAAYMPGMDIPSFSFYYLADEEHDPTHDAVWTPVYVDPAGQGWMTSVIAPVYVGGKLEGVVGIDVTVTALVGEVLAHPQAFDGYSILLDENGTIMAMPPAGEETFGLKELTDVDYATFVKQDVFKPEQFNITKRPDTAELSTAVMSSASGHATVDIAGEKSVIAWELAPRTGWRVVSIVPAAAVNELDAPSNRLRDAAVSVFWIVFAALALLTIGLTYRARRLSLAFTRPLENIDQATARIAAGDFNPVLPPAPIAELQRTGEQLLAMGSSLEDAQRRMLNDSQRLRDGEQRYRAIFENVAEPVMTVDALGIIVDANDAAHDAFGEELAGSSVAVLLGEESWRVPGRRTVEIGSHEQRRTLELAVGRSGAGAATLYTITVHDITAEVRARHLLEEASATAQHTARLKDEFLASMSHEIRTPLNGVVGVLSLLGERPLPEEARRELAVARRSADDLLVLVNDVLDFAKIEAGQVSVVARDVRLFDVLEGVRHLYTPLAEEQGNELRVQIEDDVPPWVRLDPTRVRQVLMNLVNNALKFTEHGTVSVAVDRLPSTDPDHFVLRFSVADSGVGIDAELRDRLFTRFTQGDPLNARRFPGTGLGLAIVKRLVELMDGTVGVTSEPGKGSRFWFTVPSSEGESSADAGGAVHAMARGGAGQLRVLVAEDNEVNRFLMVAMLEKLGHHVVTVVNGREAVDAAQNEHFDVVMMDVQMPVANGIDATQAIRALPGHASEVPIIAVTANVLPEQQALYARVGFTDWLPKPLTLEQLQAMLVSLFGRPADAPSGADADDTRSEPEPEVPVFDATLVAQHRRLFGEDGVRQLLATFETSLADRRAAAHEGLVGGDLEGVRAIGHTIKGMGGSVGARRLWIAGERLQHAADADIMDAVAALDEQAEVTLAAMNAAWWG